MADRGIRFSIQIPRYESLAAVREKVRRADDLGFAAISISDHLRPGGIQNFAPLVTLAAVAGMSGRLRLTTAVLDNDFRHPAMLACEAATLDVLSEGRLDLAMGAGWLEGDYTTTGITTFDPGRVRYRRYMESFRLVRRLLDGETVTASGDNYRFSDFVSYPRPVQQPLPLIVGGRRRGMLSFAAREANGINVLARDVPGGTLLSSFEEQHGWITAARGARADLTIAIRVPYGEVAAPGESPIRAAERIADRMKLTPEQTLESPFMFVGDLASIRDHVVGLRERFGVTSFTVSEDIGFAIAPVVGELSR